MSVGAAGGGSESFGYGMQRRMAAKRERDKATRTKRVRGWGNRVKEGETCRFFVLIGGVIGERE